MGTHARRRAGALTQRVQPGRTLICSLSHLPALLPPQGIHIVTPNKKLGSGPLEQYQTVRRMQREGYIHFFYEVGAGQGEG